MSNNKEKPTLKIEFDNQKALKAFGTWLCEQGEAAMKRLEEDAARKLDKYRREMKDW